MVSRKEFCVQYRSIYRRDTKLGYQNTFQSYLLEEFRGVLMNSEWKKVAERIDSPAHCLHVLGIPDTNLKGLNTFTALKVLKSKPPDPMSLGKIVMNLKIERFVEAKLLLVSSHRTMGHSLSMIVNQKGSFNAN